METTKEIVAGLRTLQATDHTGGPILGGAIAELERLDGLINTPHTQEFLKAVELEAAHQVLRFGDEAARSKSSENWFFLISYLAGKAVRASIEGDRQKALHHTISSAAALMHWHSFLINDESTVGLGTDEDLEAICDQFGLGGRTHYRCYSLGDERTELFVARDLEDLFEWLATQKGAPKGAKALEISLSERVLAGPGSTKTCTILEALVTRLLSGDLPPFQLVTRFA